MKFQIKYFFHKNGQKEFIKTLPMDLSLNSFNEEEYNSGWNEIVINSKKTMSGGYLSKSTMRGSFRLISNIKKLETVFEVSFDLIHFKKTFFTFLFYDNLYITIEIERIENE